MARPDDGTAHRRGRAAGGSGGFPGRRESPSLVRTSRARRLREILAAFRAVWRREMRGMLRDPRTFWLSLLVVAVASLAPLLSWPVGDTLFAAETAMRCYAVYLATLAAFAILVVPVVAATAFTVERDRNTLELVLASPLDPAGIFAGKWLTAASLYALLVGLSLPLLSLLQLMGGITPGAVLSDALELVLLAAVCSAVRLGCALVVPSTTVAPLAACIVSVAVSTWLTGATKSGFVVTLTTYLGAESPDTSGVNAPVGAIGYAIALVFLLYLGGSLLGDLRRREATFPEVSARARESRRVWCTALTSRVLGRTREGIPDRWNPVFVKSLRTEILASGAWEQFVFWLGFFGVWIMALFTLGWEYSGHSPAATLEGARWVLSIVGVVTLLVFPILAMQSLGGELEASRLESLRSSQLGPFEVLLGKAYATLFSARNLYAVVLLACLPPFVFRIGYMEWLWALTFLAHAAIGMLSILLVAIGSGAFAAVYLGPGFFGRLGAYLISWGVLILLPGALEVWFPGSGPRGEEVSPLMLAFRLEGLTPLYHVNSRQWLGDTIYTVTTANGIALSVATALLLTASSRFAHRWHRGEA